MPQMNADDWPTQIAWVILTFTILLVLMWSYALPRVRRVLDNRRAKIADDVGKAEAFKAEAEAALKAYQTALAEARAKAQTMLTDMQARLDQEATAQRAKLDAELSAKAADAEARIRKARADAMASLREVASDAAREATRRLIGVEPDRAAVEAAVKSAFESKA